MFHVSNITSNPIPIVEIKLETRFQICYIVDRKGRTIEAALPQTVKS